MNSMHGNRAEEREIKQYQNKTKESLTKASMKREKGSGCTLVAGNHPKHAQNVYAEKPKSKYDSH